MALEVGDLVASHWDSFCYESWMYKKVSVGEIIQVITKEKERPPHRVNSDTQTKTSTVTKYQIRWHFGRLKGKTTYRGERSLRKVQKIVDSRGDKLGRWNRLFTQFCIDTGVMPGESGERQC